MGQIISDAKPDARQIVLGGDNVVVKGTRILPKTIPSIGDGEVTITSAKISMKRLGRDK